MAEKKQEKQQEEKKYRTLTEVLDAPAGECLDVVAIAAPAIERLVNKCGLIDYLVENGGTANSVEEAKGYAKIMTSTLLRYALGECQDDAVAIIAAINGITPEELRSECTGWELVSMIKTMVTDKDFFQSLQAFTG